MKKLYPFVSALLLSASASAQCYSVSPTTYAADTVFQTAGTIVPVSDDRWSDVVPIGFTFCFYGNQYDSVIIGDNGLVSFEIQYALNYCIWPIGSALPSSSMISPKNAIGVPYQDLYILSNPQQHIYAYTSGTAPNRTFNVVYDSIAMYSCLTDYYSGRLILYEGSNDIAVHIKHKGLCTLWNGGNGIEGVEDVTGTSAVTVPGRNFPTQWTATNDAWLFSPTCSPCAITGIHDKDAEMFSIYPNPSNGNFTLWIQNSTITSYTVVDVSGREIISAPTNGAERVDLSLGSAGVYFVLTYDQEQSFLSKQRIIVN